MKSAEFSNVCVRCNGIEQAEKTSYHAFDGVIWGPDMQAMRNDSSSPWTTHRSSIVPLLRVIYGGRSVLLSRRPKDAVALRCHSSSGCRGDGVYCDWVPEPVFC